MAERISRFKELRVYQLAFELQQEIFEASKLFPIEERYALTDQIRRSSRSIGANLSEAWQKRRYVAHFVSKLTDADGEQAESTALAGDSGGVPLRFRERTRGLIGEMLKNRSDAGNHDGKTGKVLQTI